MAENKILVVKLGGGEGLDLEASCADLAAIAQQRLDLLDKRPGCHLREDYLRSG